MAERPCERGSMLLLNEFFEVIVKEKGQKDQAQVYQAVGFSVQGLNFDTDENNRQAGGSYNLTQVKGVYYAPAIVVLGYRRLPDNAHTYDDENASSDADLQLREGLKELVKISNCTAWFDMTTLTDGKPMVVHPLDIKTRGVVVAGKDQHYVCGSEAHEEEGGGFRISPLARSALVSMPCSFLGEEYESVTGMWGVMDDVFSEARGVLRSGNGVRSGSFTMPFSFAEYRFWNQVSDTKASDWKTTNHSKLERRFDAAFNYQQLSRDFTRREVTYRSKKDFARLQFVSGIFGLVGVSQFTEQGAANISRFRTGTILRVCTSDECYHGAPEKGPGKVLADDYWKSRKGEHGTFKMRFDRVEGKKHGTLTVRMVWHELTYRDIDGFEDQYLIV